MASSRPGVEFYIFEMLFFKKKKRLFKKRIGCRDHTRPIGPTAFTTRLFMENVCRKRRGEVCAVCWGQEARPGRPAGGQTVTPQTSPS